MAQRHNFERPSDILSKRKRFLIDLSSPGIVKCIGNLGEWLNGRVVVSKTIGCVFESRLPCQSKWRDSKRWSYRWRGRGGAMRHFKLKFVKLRVTLARILSTSNIPSSARYSVLALLVLTNRVLIFIGFGDQSTLPSKLFSHGQDRFLLCTISGFTILQINSSDGTLNTLGTFGNRNANAAAWANTSACRQGWDITAVDVSALLEPGMTTAVARFTTAGDLYVPNCLAMQIDSLGARLEVVKSADKSFAQSR